MAVTIPANTTGTVYIPARDAAQLTESGKPIAHAGAVRFLRMQRDAAVYAVGSGVYRFRSSFLQTTHRNIEAGSTRKAAP